MNEETAAKKVLLDFLACELETSKPVFDRFAELDRAVPVFAGGKQNFVYIPGTREDRVVFVAHTDTVWDDYYNWGPGYEAGERDKRKKHRVAVRGSIVRQGGSDEWGLGADDRAGCALLWLLKDSGHSLLLTDGEEHGQIGANYLMSEYPELAEELNSHNYMIQLDRRNGNDYKTYSLPVTNEFRAFIEAQTPFADAGRTSRTDIVTLCRKICGVNFSVGYHYEHSPREYLDIDEWLNVYRIVRRLLEQEQPRFPLEAVD